MTTEQLKDFTGGWAVIEGGGQVPGIRVLPQCDDHMAHFWQEDEFLKALNESMKGNIEMTRLWFSLCEKLVICGTAPPRVHDIDQPRCSRCENALL